MSQVLFFREHDYKKSPDLPSEVEERQVICRLLQAMDIDILDYSITKEQGFDDPSLILTHGKADGNTFFVSFNEESTGIRKLLTLIPLVVKSLRLGSLLLADDLDNVLHPHLLRFILSL